jgi:spore maturation protein CgeB
VRHINSRALGSQNKIVGGLSVRVGLWPLAPYIEHRLKALIRELTFDLVWIDGAPELSTHFYQWLHRRGCIIVNYVTDDPFGGRDGRKWDLYRQALPWHDVTVVLREPNVLEAMCAGARNVVRAYFSYDPVAHASPICESPEFTSEVVFIGSWMPERGPFLAKLRGSGTPLSIWGNMWERAPEWNELRSAWRGPSIHGQDYRSAIKGAKVALGLLSKGNRDLHTQRSVEVPIVGGAAFCGERTSEHECLLPEGTHALHWNNAAECALQCRRLLAEGEQARKTLAVRAQTRIRELGLSNDAVLAAILRVAAGGEPNHAFVQKRIL